MLNNIISDNSKRVIEFCLKQIPELRERIENQIKCAIIAEDSSPYYCILKFKYNDISVPKLPANLIFDITVQVLCEGSEVPGVIILYVRHGILEEFEYFNADSSCIDINKLCDYDSKICLDLYDGQKTICFPARK